MRLFRPNQQTATWFLVFGLLMPLPALSQDAVQNPVPDGSAIPPVEEETPVVLPTDVTLPPDQAVLSYLMRKGFFNPFPDNVFNPSQPITRAEFVTLLYRASEINTPFVSEFAYFIDLPTDHWAYVPVEGLRMRGLLKGNNGRFFPNEAMTRMEASLLMSKTLDKSWLNLTPQEINATLAAYAQHEMMIPEWAQPDLARTVFAGLLQPIPGSNPDGALVLALDKPLTRMDAAHMVYRRTLLQQDDSAIQESRLAWIPPGIRMSISPTSAISSEGLFVNQVVYFSLVEDVEVEPINVVLPRGTRIHGNVTELTPDRSRARIILDKADMPSGESYNLSSSVVLTFKLDEKQQSYVVPGQNFTITTVPGR